MDNKKLWQKILGNIKSEISDVNFKSWFSNVDIHNIEEDRLILSTPSAFFQEQLNIRYLSLIEKTVQSIINKDLRVEFIVDASKSTKRPPNIEVEEFFQPQYQPTQFPILNPKYTLENFVVGPSNNIAYAAAQALVANPGLSYNPLYIYGGTGVGKTHLMIGVGNAILKTDKSTKVIYCSSENFLNDYVEAIRNNKMADFRKKYRSVNLLLIDDIQFFSGREGVQEEFFHTFNELQGKNSQMIFTSDRPPNQIAKLEDRLKSRFAGGLMVDIQTPDFDTRVAILKAKCKEHGENLDEESLKIIATSMESNIRELEGKLTQIIQVLKTENKPLTSENIASFFQTSTKRLTNLDPKQIINIVCEYFNLNQKDLIGPKRQKSFVLPRHMVMYILVEEFGLTVERVGQILGGRDHTTVMHGRDKIKGLLMVNREIQQVYTEVRQKI